jgi:hypothetical protein
MKKPKKYTFRDPDGRVVSKEGESLEAAINKLGREPSFDGEGLNTFDIIVHGKTVKYAFLGHHG